MKLASTVAFTMLCFASVGTLAHAVEGAGTGALVASARQRVEATDSRASGRLVRVDANGNHITNHFEIKAHFFPGVLRVLLEVDPSRTSAEEANQGPTQETRLSFLFETHPDGQGTIRIFRPHESASALLPFSKWSEGVSGGKFSYEDFLQPEFFWQHQTKLKSARLGTHECDVLESVPGAADRSHYAEVQTWIDQTTGYPMYVEKISKEPALLKEFTSLGLTQSGGVWAARQVEAKVHSRPGSTLLIFEHGSTKAHLTPKDFSPEQIEMLEDRP